jgi:hypothetical protein
MTITVTTADAAENLDRAGGRVMRLLVDADATGQRLSALACEAPTGEARRCISTRAPTSCSWSRAAPCCCTRTAPPTGSARAPRRSCPGARRTPSPAARANRSGS